MDGQDHEATPLAPAPEGVASPLEGVAAPSEAPPARPLPPVEPPASLPKRIFRGVLFVALVATGLLIAHNRHPAMKGQFLGPDADAAASEAVSPPGALRSAKPNELHPGATAHPAASGAARP